MSTFKTFSNKLASDQNLVVIILLSFIIALGSALRIYDLGAESYWIDELVLLTQVGQTDLGAFLRQIPFTRPPIYILLTYIWVPLFGTAEVATRSLSAILGVATLPVMYAVGRELFDRKVALISTFILAISGYHIFWSQTFRYYSLGVLLTVISYFLYIRALKSGSGKGLVLYTVVAILLFYTHPLNLFIIGAQGLYFVLQWNTYKALRKPWVLCQVLLLISITPLTFAQVDLALDILTGTPRAESHPMQGGEIPPLWAPIDTLRKFLFYRMYWTAVASGAIFSLIGILFFVIQQGRVRWLASLKDLATNIPNVSSSQRANLLLLGLWLFCPIVALFILARIIGGVYSAHYLIGAAPALYLLLAFAITMIGKVAPEPVSIGFLVIIMAVGLQDYYVSSVRAEYREAATYLEENAEAGDVLVFARAWYTQYLFDYYYQSKNRPWQLLARKNLLVASIEDYQQGNIRPGCDLATEAAIDDEVISTAITRCTVERQRIWLITPSLSEDVKQLAGSFFNSHLETLTQEQRFREVSIYLFESGLETITDIQDR